MSGELVPRKDPGSRVIREMLDTAHVGGVTGVAIALTVGVPGFGWMFGAIGACYLGYRAFKRGIKSR